MSQGIGGEAKDAFIAAAIASEQFPAVRGTSAVVAVVVAGTGRHYRVSMPRISILRLCSSMNHKDTTMATRRKGGGGTDNTPTPSNLALA